MPVRRYCLMFMFYLHGGSGANTTRKYGHNMKRFLAVYNLAKKTLGGETSLPWKSPD